MLAPNETLRIGGAVFAPVTYPCIMTSSTWDPQKCLYPGIIYEFMFNMVHMAGVTLQVVPQFDYARKFNWGRFNATTGRWSGMFGLVNDGVVDTIFPSYHFNTQRYQHFDYLFDSPSPLKDPVFIVGLPKSTDTLSLKGADVLYAMFQPALWASFGVSILLCLSVLGVATNIYKDHTRRSNSSTNFVWDTLSMILDQYDGVCIEWKLSAMLSMLTLGFMTLFLHSLYEGYLVTMMLNSKRGMPFNSMSELADLVAQKEYHVISYSKDDNFFRNLRNTTIPYLNKMANALQVNPPVIKPNMTKMLEIMDSNDRYVHPGRNTIMATVMIKGRCNLLIHRYKEAVSLSYTGLPFKRGSKWVAYLQPFATSMNGWGSSYIERLVVKYLDYETRKDPCPRSPGAGWGNIGQIGESESIPALSLRHFYSITILWFIGLGVALVTVIGEFIYKRVQHKQDMTLNNANISSEQRRTQRNTNIITVKAHYHNS